jgi:hypothetical protein
MSAFLNSVKADLLDRRIAPIVVLVVAALIGAVAYVAIGGGSASSKPSASISTPVSPGARGIAVGQASTSKAVAETTEGVSEQRKGAARNPFALLPGAKTETHSAAPTPSSSTSASASSGTPSSSGSSPSSSPSSSSSPSASSTPSSGSAPSSPRKSEPAPSKPSAPSKPQPVYHVAIEFGVVPSEASPEQAQLTPYENLKLFTPLPSAQLALVAYRGVTASGKSATFTLVGEVILHGSAACLPSASQCQAIGLKEGQTEQLEYLPPSGQPVTYELRVVSIAAASASAASVKTLLGDASKAGRALLAREGLMALPGLRYSPASGMLVLAGHPAFAAHVASHRRSRR